MIEYFFVISAQRSGSNWLRACLDYHPKIRLRGEIHPSGILTHFDKMQTGDHLSDERMRERGVFQKTGRSTVIELMRYNNFYPETGNIEDFDGYQGDKTAFPCGKSLLKHPEQYEYVKLLQRYFPDSKIILLVRDLPDVIVSYSKWKNGFNLLGHNPLAWFFFLRHMGNWCKLHARWINDMADNPNSMVLHYNDLKDNFRDTLNGVFDFLMLPADKLIVDDIEAKFFSITGQYYQQENKKRGYAFYRKGIVGEWQQQFKWYQKIIYHFLYAQKHKQLMEKIRN